MAKENHKKRESIIINANLIHRKIHLNYVIYHEILTT